MKNIEKAISEVEAGNVSEGLQLLEQAAKTSDDEKKYEIAKLYIGWGFPDLAQPVVKELLAHYPDENELVFLLADILIETDRVEHAIDWLLKIDSWDKDGVRALLMLADIYTEQGLDEVAEQKLLKAKQIDPDEPVVILALAEFYFAVGEDLKCIPYYENLLRQKWDTQHANIHDRLAEALSRSGRFEEAMLVYEKALDVHETSDLWFGLGMTAYQAGEYDKAIHAFEKLKQSDPDYIKLYGYLAKSYKAQGEFSKAFDTAVEGLQIYELSDELTCEAGISAFQAGQFENAELYLKKTLSIDPLHHDALQSLAGLYLRIERYEEIIDLLELEEAEGEMDPVFFWYLATAYHHEERYDNASKYFEKAYPGLSEDPSFLEEYGDFLLEEGQNAKATSLFEKALSLDPSLTHLEDKITHFED